MKRSDLVASIILAAVGIGIIAESISMPYFGNRLDSPGSLPFVLGVIIFFCSISIGINAISNPDGEGEISTSKLPKWSDPQGRKVYAMVVLTVSYVILIRHFHFLYTTIVFLPITFFALGIRNIMKLVALSVIPTIIVYLVFTRLFRVILP